MDIKLTHTILKDYLETKATPEQISQALSLCGPTVDRLHKLENEHVYDIEIITNRIDCASAFGVAREAATILPQFGHSATLKNNPYDLTLQKLGKLPLEAPVKVQILDSSLVPRFACIALEVSIGDSPKETKKLLELIGERSINNIVDISNELTTRYGQPTHIFDLDKITGNLMKLRASKKGESITTLDGKKHILRGNDIVIEDESGKLIDLCGVMGGGLSEVDDNTKKVLLFVQKYEPKRIRQTSLYTQERTVASQIFEKDPDPELVLPVLIEGVKLLQERVNAKIISNIIDIYPNPSQPKHVQLDLNWLNTFVGINFQTKQVTDILNNLGFKTKTVGDLLVCEVPSWRLNDVTIPQDLAEEIARIYGYFRLPSNLPPTVIPNTSTSPLLENELTTRKYLSHIGFTEIYNYALVGEDIFQKSQLQTPNIKVKNPLSSDYEYMRTSLLPSLLYDLQQNRGKTTPPLRIFELSSIYLPQEKGELANEISTLALATQGVSFQETKGYLEALARHLRVELIFKPQSTQFQPFIKTQSADILINKEVVGTIGYIDPTVLSNFSIEEEVVIAHLNFEILSKHVNPIHHFKPISEFPSIFQDVTIESKKSVGELSQILKDSHQLISSVNYITSYQNKHTFQLEFTSYESNLSQEDVNNIKEKILSDII